MEDAESAVEAGADALGFVFYPPSPRYIFPEKAAEIIRGMPPLVSTVGVFVNVLPRQVRRIAIRSGINTIQLHGDESSEYARHFMLPVIKSFQVSGICKMPDFSDYQVAGYLLDTPVPGKFGGTGIPNRWECLKEQLDLLSEGIHRKMIIAGGLNPSNVRDVIQMLRPGAVDVSSGVEDAPGIKNSMKIKEFIHAVHSAQAK